MEYNSESEFRLVIEDLKQNNACSDAMTVFDRCSDKTLGQAVDILISSENNSWIIWFFKKCRKILDIETRKRLLFAIGDEPAVMFRLFISIDDLTDEEDEILEGVFKGKLPTAEEELKIGEVERNKKE